MSTSYYALRSPFTGAAVARDDGTSVIRITARDETDAEVRCSSLLEGVILLALADRDERIAHRSGGRVSAAHHLPDSLQLVSEYGDLTTLGEVRRGVVRGGNAPRPASAGRRCHRQTQRIPDIVSGSGGANSVQGRPPGNYYRSLTMPRIIEVRHEGGLVYLDGHGMTAAEADSLARLLQAGASDARGWAIWQQKDAERAAERARLEATGLTHIVSTAAGYLARRDGLPVVVRGLGETPAGWPGQLGDGPPLEARVYGGRKWRPVAELSTHQHVSAWRVAP